MNTKGKACDEEKPTGPPNRTSHSLPLVSLLFGPPAMDHAMVTSFYLGSKRRKGTGYSSLVKILHENNVEGNSITLKNPKLLWLPKSTKVD